MSGGGAIHTVVVARLAGVGGAGLVSVKLTSWPDDLMTFPKCLLGTIDDEVPVGGEALMEESELKPSSDSCSPEGARWSVA
ncbi:hypothetical protein U1Q18_023330 [Sarracenia purpurea var. burkii]